MNTRPAATFAAVIGHPVAHSLSPAMFNAMFTLHNRDWLYEAIDVEQDALETFLRRVRSERFGAFSVTMPLKSSIVSHLDSLDTAAKALGAVNSVVVGPHGLKGFNTDGDGCCDALETSGGAVVDGARAVVFGAGGTARSIALALANRGASVSFINRTDANASRAVEMVRSSLPGSDVRRGTSDDVLNASIVVNATPVGMGETAGSSIVDGSRVPREAVVLDAVYQPLETAFLRDARTQGARVVDGLWMLVYQAVRQYSLWFGVDADARVMREAAEQELSRRHK